MGTKNLLIRGGADFSGLRRSLIQAQNDISNFKKGLKKSLVGIGATLAGLGIGIYLKDAVKQAMNFEASVQQLNRLMGNSALEFMKWANSTAASFNMSKSEAVQYGATFSNIISTFSKGTKQTQQYTQNLLQATAVVASKTGRSMEDALERVRSGMLGNTEAIEDLGLFVNVSMIESTKAFQQFANGRSWDQIDFRTQQTIRYFAILEQAAQKYGVEVGNNANSQTARFVAQLSNLKLAIGQAFMPIWQVVLPALTSFIGYLVKAANTVAQFTQLLFGKQSVKQAQSQANAINQQKSAVGGLGDSYKKAGKEAKKAQGFLAGFDEVNTISDSSSGSSSGGDVGVNASDLAGGSPSATSLDLQTNAMEVSEKVKAAVTAIKQFFSDIKSFVTEHKDIIIAALAGIAAGFATFLFAANFTKIIGAFESLYLAILIMMDGLKAGLAAAFGFLASPIGIIVIAVAALTAAFVYFYRTNDKFKGFVDGILNQIKDAAIYLWNNVLVPFGKFLGAAFVASWDAVKVAAQWLWKNVLVPLGDYFMWIWKNAILPIASVLKDILGVAFKFVADVAMSLWKNVLVPLGDFFVSIFGPTVEAISAVFSFLWNNVLVPLGEFLGGIFKEKFKQLADIIQFLWYNVLKPLVTFILGVFKTGFETVFKSLGEIINGLKTAFIGLMKFITGVFTGDWEKAWNGIKDIFKGVFEALYSYVKTPLNLIISAINAVISGLNSISIDIPEWVPKFGGQKFGINIPRIPKLARGGIVDSPTIAQIGEAGREMVVPLENTSFVDKLASALGSAVLSAMQFNNSSSASGDTVLNIDGRTVARVLKPYLDGESKRVGSNVKLNPI